MKVAVTIKLSWDKPGGESLADFRKKYESMKAHVERLQLKGHLPANEIRWVVEKLTARPVLTEPAKVIPMQTEASR